MSASEDLESLDNKTLRAKCLEYGLPNVPITDTSKKILIKKLRAAMEGTNNLKGVKGRRETMHVTSTTTMINTEKDENKPFRASNRRTTIAAVRKEKESTPKDPAPIAEKRRTSRATPVQETSIPVSITKKNVPLVIEETDFDEEFILIDDDDYHQPVVTNIPIIRQSRSPSLSKSAVVTTSYKKDTLSREQKILEEEETEEEGYTEKHKEYNLSKQFVPHREKDISISTIPRYSLNARVSTEKDIFPTGYKPLYPTLSKDPLQGVSKSVYESSSKLTKRNYTDSENTKPTMLSTKIRDFDSINRKKISQYTENSDSNCEEDDILDQAPYLSDFAKRLSTLKAEKLDLGVKKELYSPGESYPRSVGRRTYGNNNPEKGGVGDSIGQLWTVLDRKYKIKRFIFVVSLLTAIILLIYYFHLQNN